MEGFHRNVSESEGEIILPLVLRYLTPNASIKLFLSVPHLMYLISEDVSVIFVTVLLTHSDAYYSV